MVNDKRAILVTGATGFLGRRFVEKFSAAYPQIPLRLLIHRVRPAGSSSNDEIVEGSLQDEDSLAEAVQGVGQVIHFAAVTHAARPKEYFRVNFLGTANLVRVAETAGVTRLILISSRAIYPECGDYASSKLRAEEKVRAHTIPYVILRFSEVYGPGGSEGLGFLFKLVRWLPIVPYPSGKIFLAPLFLDDAVDSIIRIVERPMIQNKVYTVTGPHSYSLSEVIDLASKYFDRKRLLVPVPLWFLRLTTLTLGVLGLGRFRYDQINRMLCPKDYNIYEARRDFGFSPLSLEEGLARLQVPPQ